MKMMSVEREVVVLLLVTMVDTVEGGAVADDGGAPSRPMIVLCWQRETFHMRL